MSKYKAYPSYKDSGVEWLGDVPEHWEVGRIKNSAMIFNGATPKSVIKEYWDGDISWIGPADMGKINSRNIFKGARDITFSGYSSCGTMLVPKGSVILSSRAPIGKVAIAGKALCTNQGCKSLVINQYFSNIFIFYILIANTKKLNLLGRGTTFLELSAEELSSFRIPLPPLQEQKTIANYLDKATAKIDTLIAKQTKLIELLAEKRQAVISTAVTRGLDSTVAMKESGVAWLGEIPEGWEVWKMAHAFKTIGSGTTPTSTNESYYNGYIPWVTTGELRENTIISTKKLLTDKAITDNSSLKLFPIGSVIIAMYGATIGRLGVLGIKATTNQACCVMTDSSSIRNEYLYYWLMGYRDEIIKLGYGGGQPNISQDTISTLKVSAPSIAEQQTIINHLDQKTTQIDTLITKATQAIALLKERRTALISAVVTGKVDVRGQAREEML